MKLHHIEAMEHVIAPGWIWNLIRDLFIPYLPL